MVFLPMDIDLEVIISFIVNLVVLWGDYFSVMDERLQSLHYSGKECYHFPLELYQSIPSIPLMKAFLNSIQFTSIMLPFHCLLHYFKQFVF